MVLDGGVVERLSVEDDPTLVSVSSVATLQDQLNAAEQAANSVLLSQRLKRLVQPVGNHIDILQA